MKTLIASSILFTSLFAQASLKDLNDQTPPFKLAPLPYAADSLGKAIDA